jgi:hypothetical protein
MDFLPNSNTQVPHIPPRERPEPAAPFTQQQILPECSPTPELEPSVYKTLPNDFGLYRVYTSYPTKEQDDHNDLENLCDSPGLATSSSHTPGRWWKSLGISQSLDTKNGLFAPFLNASVFRLFNWFYSGSNTKSIAELDSLVNNVLLAKDFDTQHLKDFSAARELRRLDSENEDLSPFSKENGWKTSTVHLPLPAEGVKHDSEDSAPVLDIPVHHRGLLETITSAFQDESARYFHFIPFKMFWKSAAHSTPERVITEAYNSDAFIEEHEKISKQPPEPGPNLETVIAALMLWSDSTHLANFGNASLWPIYLFFGNQSKYSRSKPTDFAAHHIAYLPSVSCSASSQFCLIDY